MRLETSERFGRRRVYPDFQGQPCPRGLTSAAEARRRRMELDAEFSRYKETVRASEYLMSRVEDLSASASRLKAHSETLKRESQVLLRELQTTLAAKSRLERALDD